MTLKRKVLLVLGEDSHISNGRFLGLVTLLCHWLIEWLISATLANITSAIGVILVLHEWEGPDVLRRRWRTEDADLNERPDDAS